MKKAFDIGAVFSRGFGIWWKNLGSFVALTLIVGLPMAVLFALVALAAGLDMGWLTEPTPPPGPMTPEETQRMMWGTFGAIGVVAIFFGLAYQVIMIAVVLGTEAAHAGRRWSIGEVLRRSFGHVPRALLAGLVMIVPIAFGFAMCCLPGIFLFVVWYLVIPALVLENLGPIAAMKRSWELVLAQFWYVLLLSIALAAVSSVIAMVVGIAGVFSPILELIGNVVNNVFLTSLAPVLQTVAFLHLRRHAEGDPADQIAEVFD